MNALRHGIVLAVIAAAMFAFPARSQTLADYTPPPRTVEDILAVLDQYKPDPAAIAQRTRTAEREPPATDDRQKLAQFHLERARARGALGQVSRQLEDLRLAAQYAKGTMTGSNGSDVEDEGDEARILQELSVTESGSGNFLNAVRAREELLHGMQLFTRPRRGMLLSAQTGLASMHAAMGDLPAARQFLSRAEAMLLRLRRSPSWDDFGDGWSAALERARASIFIAEGKYAAAEASLRKVVQLMDHGQQGNLARFRSGRKGTPPGRYLASRNGDELRLAWTLMQQSRLAEAEAAARNALVRNLSFFGRYAPASAGGLLNLSRIIFEQGRYREAGLLAAAAIEGFEKSGAAPESRSFAEARKAYGAALVAQGQWKEAVPVYERMQEGLARDPLVLQIFGKGDINWAYALVKTGQSAKAAAMLQDLLDTLRRRLGEDDRAVAELRGYLGIALAANGETQRALAEFRLAVPVLLDAARADQAAETGGIARWMRLTNVLEAYLALLVDLHRAGTQVAGLDPVAEAFRIADVARGSNVQRALTGSAARAAIRDPQLAEIARREQDAQHRIGVLSDLLSRLLAASRDQQLPKVIADVRRDLDEVRRNRAELRRELERRFPEYAELTDPKPATLAQAQAVLRPGEALIAIYVGPERTYVWALPQQGNASFAVANLGQAQIAGMVSRLRQALDVGDAPLARFPKFDLALAYQLYAQLLGPVEAGWKNASSLLIAPHGALGQLPFAVLPTEPYQLKPDSGALFINYRDAPWLIKRAAITQLPSVNTLATLRRSSPARPGRREFIGFGDPFFSKSQAAAAEKQQTTASTATTRGVRLRNLAVARAPTAASLIAEPGAEAAAPAATPAVNNSAGLAQLAPLPDTSDEILGIALVLRADPRQDVYLHERASETVLKKLDLSRRRVLAFATHGLVPGDLNGLTQPALALSAPEVVGGEDDGLLTMEEILALKLDADWVVLSACNTAAGDGAGSEAVSGLGKAFFYAGARALLVSNWPVETVSARMLTTELFRRQAQSPAISRAEALRQTMLALINGAATGGAGPGSYSYAHPMFWAPFSLVGDG